MIRDQWTRWVERLAQWEVGVHCCNPYARNRTRANAARRHNLAHYLREMAALRPKIVLVGEALGYRGGRVTGIPFSSAQLLATHPWYSHSDYWRIEAPLPQAEATATLMHAVLGQIGVRPLCWNAFPFHPHQPNRVLSNRKPTADELRTGGDFAAALIAAMQIEVVVAVGKSAEKALTQLQIQHHAVRHPSHGGKYDFHAGLLRIVSKMSDYNNQNTGST